MFRIKLKQNLPIKLSNFWLNTLTLPAPYIANINLKLLFIFSIENN